MTKVLLINPFLTIYPDDPAGINPVLSLAYLAGYLESKKVEVKIIDIAAEGANQIKKIKNKVRYGLGDKEVVRKIKEYGPRIVGITCQSTLHAEDACETARLVKKASKNILVVMGGAHPSSTPEEVLKDKNVDIVVRGEGEVTFEELIKNYPKNRDFSDIKGISWRKGQKIIHNPPRLLVENIDSLPFPARHLLPMEIYFNEAQKNTSYNMRKRVFTMITSRGCPGNCIYCAVRTVWGRSWRGRSPGNVVDEIESLVRDYHAEEIHFLDDSISVDTKRLSGICEEIVEREINIKWTVPNGIAIWLLDKKLIKKMKASGCYRLTFGLESGNKRILHDFVGKDYNYAKAKKMISFASKLGLWTLGTFIIGFPYETEGQIEETIDFAIDTDLDFATFYLANPFPGTPLFEIYKKEKLLPPGGAYEIVRGCRSKLFSYEELTGFQQEAFSRFLKSRWRKPSLLLRKLNSTENAFYTIKLLKNFLPALFNQSGIKDKGIASFWKKK